MTNIFALEVGLIVMTIAISLVMLVAIFYWAGKMGEFSNKEK